MNVDEEKIKHFIETTPESEVLKHISFDFNSITAWNGYLQTYLTLGGDCIETLIDTVILKESGIEFDKENDKLKRFALSQFKIKELKIKN